MDKKEALSKIQEMSIEEKIFMLTETQEAYVRGFIEGAILEHQEQRHENKPSNQTENKGNSQSNG